MGRLVAAPDKFRGTATAREAAAAIAEGAARAGWTAVTIPMSDGGEGFCEVLGGERHHARVHGPLGELVTATWSLLDDGTAVIESAQAAGRALVRSTSRGEPLRADTYGVGELIAAALAARPASLLVGCGGSASTDGGRGCVRALGDLGVTLGIPVFVACDVRIAFREAATAFGPQKGASPDQVAQLARRLDADAAWYREHFGRDVALLPGAGAAGGLAGGLAALGGTLVDGAALVAARVGLDAALAAADLVVTGEGRVDRGTLEGKVVATVLALRPALDALVLAGQVADDAPAALARQRAGRTDVVTLPGDLDVAAGIAASVARRLAGDAAGRG